ncbi:MAG: ATP-binding protein [Candidatus Gastranaerophilales bacterium]|nr:ATP-binding protein [Candidatus Gastranaerophilales bacterium]
MNNQLDQNDNRENKSGLMGLSTQNKLIILGSLLCSFFIVVAAWVVIKNTQDKIDESYQNYGSMLAKTLAISSIDVVSEYPVTHNLQKLQNHTKMLLKNSNDISFIIFTDEKGSILYSSKKFSNQDSIYSVPNVPIVSINENTENVVGTVQIGLTGYTRNIVAKSTRNLMIIIFTIAWFLSIAAVLINTLLITRQIKLLSEGVRRISTGEFGYKLTSKDLWGEIKQLFESFNDMSTRLRQYEEKNIDQLTYEKNKLEAVLMSIANGVVVCDNYDKIILVNNAAIKMLGFNAKELISSRIMDYCDSNGELCFKKEIAKFKDTPLEDIDAKPLDTQVKINSKIIQAVISPIFAFHQEYLGYILVLHDITKEAEIDRMKNSFISNVSHELRTPVTVLRSYIDTLYNYGHEFDEKTKEEFIDVLNNESDRLNRLVNDILDFSRLESPNVELEKISSDIGPIIELTTKSMKVLADERNISFSILIEPDLPKIVINPESIERVLKNLLSNAIKYSNDNGRIKIRAEIDRTGNYLQVMVEDNGIGISTEHIDKIFDRFYRIETKTHTIKGTGLGLHLAKITVEKHHGGQIFVESNLNEGSTFGFKIPLKFDDSLIEKI